MTFRLDILDSPEPGVAYVRLSGVCGRDDHHTVEEFSSLCQSRGSCSVIVDCGELKGISRHVAMSLAGLRRFCDDQGSALVVLNPSVVIDWYLSRTFGVVPIVAESVEDALAVFRNPECTTSTPGLKAPAVGASASAPGSGASRCEESQANRPKRGMAMDLERVLLDRDDVSGWTEPTLSMLSKAGLVSRLVLCRRDGDRLHVIDRDISLPADGWLVSLLANAAVAVDAEDLMQPGLTTEEQAFLKWSDTEVHMPLLHRGELVGLMSYDTRRHQGLCGLRSSEMLALESVGMVLAGCLVASESPPAAEPQVVEETRELVPAG